MIKWYLIFTLILFFFYYIDDFKKYYFFIINDQYLYFELTSQNTLIINLNLNNLLKRLQMFSKHIIDSLKMQQGFANTPFKVKMDHHSSSKQQKSTNDKIKLEEQDNAEKKCITKRAWTSYEDQLLKELVKLNNYKNWSHISNHFDKRGGKQCRERWYNHLREGINKQQWSQYEEWILSLGVSAFGNKWSKISNYLPGRTDNTIKNRWNCKMNPKKVLFSTKLSDILSKGEEYFSILTPQEQQLLRLILQKPKSKEQEHPFNQNQQEIIETCRQAILNFYQIKAQLGQHQENEQQWSRYITPKN